MIVNTVLFHKNMYGPILLATSSKKGGYPSSPNFGTSNGTTRVRADSWWSNIGNAALTCASPHVAQLSWAAWVAWWVLNCKCGTQLRHILAWCVQINFLRADFFLF